MTHDSLIKIWKCYMGKRNAIYCLLQEDPELEEYLSKSKDFKFDPHYGDLRRYEFKGKVKDDET